MTRDRPMVSERRRRWLRLGVIAVLVVGGSAVAQWRGRAVETGMHRRLLANAVAIARTVSPATVMRLSFSPADLENPVFLRLQAQLAAYARAFRHRSVWTLALREGTLVNGPESLEAGDPLASPPGTPYRHPPAQIQEIFTSRQGRTVGPYSDEDGSFVTAFVPVLDPRSGEPVLVVCLDVEARHWRLRILRAWGEPLVVTAAVILLGLLAVRFLGRRYRAELWLTAVGGTVLTLGGALLVHESETRARHRTFTQVATAQQGLLADTLRDIQDHQLSGLARFFEGSEEVTRREFQTYARPLTSTAAVQAWEWIPRVAAHDRQAFEDTAQREGLTGFHIFELDADGSPLPAHSRENHYPVWFIEPLTGNESSLGFDRASSPMQAVALSQAKATGLITGSASLILTGPDHERVGALVLHPVYKVEAGTGGPPPAPPVLEGFVAAVVDFEKTVRESLVQAHHGDEVVAVALVQLGVHSADRILAVHPRDHAIASLTQGELARLAGGDLACAFPLFLFGRTFAEVVLPGPAFLSAYPARAGVNTALVGFLLTGLLTAFVAFLSARGKELETLVDERTAELQRSEAKFRSLFRLPFVGAVITTPSGRFVSVNDRFCAILDYPREDLLTKTWADLSPAADRETGESVLDRITSGTGEGNEISTRFQRGDGVVVDVHLAAMLVRSSTGEPDYLVAVAQDISARIRADQALKESEERYRQLFLAHPLPMWVYDLASLRFLAVNRAAVITYGWSEDEFLTMSLRDIRPAEDLRRLEENVADSRRTAGYEHSTGWRHRTRDGTVLNVEISSHDITYDGCPARVVVVHDVTKRVLLEQQLRHSQKMEAVGRLAGGIAHDFNNLLQALLSTAQAARLLATEPRLLATLDEIQEQVQRGAALARQLLLFSRQEVPRRAALDLGGLLSDQVAMLRRLIPENISLAMEFFTEPLMVRGDPTQLSQVLVNLVVNACDAMPAGGRLAIRTGEREGQAWMEVEDTGAGMSPEVQERLFEPFFTTKGHGKGTGLGLAVVDGIVASHGGFLEVETEVGKGSRLRVMLPVTRDSQPGMSPEAEPQPALPVGRGEHILLVEDEQSARRALTELLMLLGYQVTAAATGEEALGIPATTPCDLLLTDIMLPGISGLEVARRFSADRPGAAVILMSGYAAEESSRRHLADGSARYLEKPFDMNTLARELHAALAEARYAGAPSAPAP